MVRYIYIEIVRQYKTAPHCKTEWLHDVKRDIAVALAHLVERAISDRKVTHSRFDSLTAMPSCTLENDS